MSTVYDFDAVDIAGLEKHLADYKGNVLLIVNTATQCGFTPQLGPLQGLYEKYAAQGLEILGFPSNQFAHQNPGTDEETASFCESRYGVTFPMFSRIDVNGKNAHPLYQFLKSERPGLLGGAIKWNFTKFLVDREGNVVKRYATATTPQDIAPDIEKLL